MAVDIDMCMQKYGIERYLYVGRNQVGIYGFTEHSPLGPIIYSLDYYLKFNNDKIISNYNNELSNSEFIIYYQLQPNEINKSVKKYIEDNFEEIPWTKISTNNLFDKNYKFFLRKKLLAI